MDKNLLEQGRRFLENAYGGYRIRVYEPVTKYISTPFITPRALYLANPTFVVTVVKSSNHDLGDYWPEMPWIFPAEVRLLAALALAIPEGEGALTFAPYPSNRRLPIDTELSLDEPEVIASITVEAESDCRKLAESQLPYRLYDWDFIQADRVVIYNRIELADSLLLRGLYCLLKGQHLMAHELFGEEAFINIQISREAALELIRKRLLGEGVKNPSYTDAHNYLRERFPRGGHLADFLEDQHDRWVATRHPKSRFGMFWTPPLLVNDYTHTHGAVVSLYRHLLLDEPSRLTADLGE
ncbi:MAG TPA: hypothetical protein VLU25_19775 [Acidobacteriota bacterium]|nr:hypothetical protein [Acidobacteriota bacterium]